MMKFVYTKLIFVVVIFLSNVAYIHSAKYAVTKHENERQIILRKLRKDGTRLVAKKLIDKTGKRTVIRYRARLDRPWKNRKSVADVLEHYSKEVSKKKFEKLEKKYADPKNKATNNLHNAIFARMRV